MLKNNTTIESVNLGSISETDLRKIAEIEKDMWAYGIGEYVKCDNCKKIHSKQDIFGHLNNELYFETVTKIEKIIGTNILCRECSSSTSFIYDDIEYFEEILKRSRENEESFLTIFRDQTGEIRGFLDAYINDIDTIYMRELESYYSEIGKDEIITSIETKISAKIPDRLLAFASMGMEERYKNFIIVLKILKNFFMSMEDNNNNLIGITELKIGSNLHSLYNLMGAIRLGFSSGNTLQNRHTSVESDLFIHPNIVLDYKRELEVPVKKFLIKNKDEIRKVLA